MAPADATIADKTIADKTISAATTTPQGPTGPRTELGKARASRNAVKNGLFATRDFIREDETAEYAETRAALYRQIAPEGCLEETFTAEILTATWRLRRCRLIESENPGPDEEKSVDRARSQSHNVLRRSLAELRKLQTERTIRLELDAEAFPALTDLRQVNTTLKLQDRQRLLARKADGLDTLEGLIAQADRQLCQEVRDSKAAAEASPEAKPETTPEPGSSFCKPVPQHARTTPRNAPCPCNSGVKYKKCCGRTGAGWPTPPPQNGCLAA